MLYQCVRGLKTMVKEYFMLAVMAIFTQNFIMVKFMGICPFLGVSKKIETAFGMGMAVMFVMVIASLLTYLTQTFILVPLHAEYLQTLAFILVIAGLVQFVEMFLAKMIPSLYESLGIYLPLITTNCAVLGVAILNIEQNLTLLGSVWYGFDKQQTINYNWKHKSNATTTTTSSNDQ